LRAAGLAADFRAAVPVLALAAVVRFAEDLRAVDFLALGFAADDRALLARAGAAEALALPSIDHLPESTRCAASATASAMRVPSFVALAATWLAAWLAVSAASMPASLIALRAFGLALIAAAAAARPAASISLLIAALASLSTVESLDLFEVDDPLRLVDFAIATLLRPPD